MPRNTREWARRKLEYACGNLDTAMTHLLAMAEPYKPDHMRIYDTARELAQSLFVIQEAIQTFRESF